LSNVSIGDVDDDAVVSSFYRSVADEDGIVRKYLELGQLAVVLDSTLYVHGGVYGVFDKSKGVESCVGFVPDGCDLSNQVLHADRDEWVFQLNQWMRNQIADILRDPAYNIDRSNRAGQALFLYGAYSPTRSVIMARMLDDASMPLQIPEETVLQLKKWGLHRVVCGHTPHGNSPTVFNCHGVEVRNLCRNSEFVGCNPVVLQVVMADTSFSDMSSKDRPTDNRGVAASEVLVCGPVLQVHGLLQDSVPTNFVTVTGRDDFQPSSQIFSASLKSFAPLDSFVGDGNIGQRTKDGYFVKSACSDHRYLLCKVSGYKYDYKYVDVTELPSLF
jgi:hypothetical protein